MNTETLPLITKGRRKILANAFYSLPLDSGLSRGTSDWIRQEFKIKVMKLRDLGLLSQDNTLTEKGLRVLRAEAWL